MFVERKVVRIQPGRWAELRALEKEFDALDSRLGFPARRYLRCYIGGQDANALVIEREWESLAALEEVYMKALADPQWLDFGARFEKITESSQVELYLRYEGDFTSSRFFFVAAWNN